MYHRELVGKLLEAFLGQRDNHLTGVFRASGACQYAFLYLSRWLQHESLVGGIISFENHHYGLVYVARFIGESIDDLVA